MKRYLDWAGYAGLAVLFAAAVLPFLPGIKPSFARYRSWLLIAGVVLVVLSLLVHLGSLRTMMRGRTARYGLNTAVMVLLLLGIIGLVEGFSYKHSKRVDLTENRRNSLSPQTIQVLGKLPTEVNAVAFFRSDQPGKRVAEDLFKQYARYSNGKFTWRVADPDREPGLARRYNVESYGTVVLETKARSEKVTDAEEEKLTNGLLKLTREGKRTIYVIQGHGEHDLAGTERPGFSEAKSALEKANYEVKPLALARQAAVPDDAKVVIIAGPRNDFFPPELDALDTYLGKGGKLLVMVNPFQAEGMKRWIGKYGVDLGDNLVVEQNPIGRLFGIGPEVPIVQQYESHAITREMSGLTTLFPLTRTVEPSKTIPAGTAVQPLARTSPDSWGETDRKALEQGQAKPDPQDPKGPLSVATVVTKDKTRIVVYGTSNLAANQFLNVQGNRDFFLNTIAWLAEEEDAISIRPRDVKSSPIFLTSQQAQAVFFLPVVVLPGLVLLGGIVTVIRRRAAK